MKKFLNTTDQRRSILKFMCRKPKEETTFEFERKHLRAVNVIRLNKLDLIDEITNVIWKSNKYKCAEKCGEDILSVVWKIEGSVGHFDCAVEIYSLVPQKIIKSANLHHN